MSARGDVQTVDKFTWIKSMGADSRLSPGERFVLSVTAIWWIHTARGTDFQVKQTTIADRLSVSERLVRSALTNARKYGWIQLNAERQRGRGNHAADAYSIAYPSEIPADLAAFSEEIPARNVGNTGKTQLCDLRE
jgi:hypothetical protein